MAGRLYSSLTGLSRKIGIVPSEATQVAEGDATAVDSRFTIETQANAGGDWTTINQPHHRGKR